MLRLFDRDRPITSFERKCVATTVVGLAVFSVLIVVAGPAYKEMFDDFGSTLPALTSHILGAVLPTCMAFLPFSVLFAFAILARRLPDAVRTTLVVLALVLSAANIVLFFVAMHLPLSNAEWQLAV